MARFGAGRQTPLWTNRRWRPERGQFRPLRAHPLAPTRAWHFDLGIRLINEQEIMAGYAYGLNSATANATLVGGTSPKTGFGLQFTGGNANEGILLGSETACALPTDGKMTVIVHKRKTDATLRNGSFFGIIDAGEPGSFAKRCGVTCPFTDGVVYFDYGGVTSGTTRLSKSGLTFGDDVWAFSVGARGMEIWQNGFLRNSNAATPTRTASAGNWYLNDGQAATNVIGDKAVYTFMYMYTRQLSQADIVSISLDPFQWLEPTLNASRLIARPGFFAAWVGQSNQRSGRHDQ